MLMEEAELAAQAEREGASPPVEFAEEDDDLPADIAGTTTPSSVHISIKFAFAAC